MRNLLCLCVLLALYPPVSGADRQVDFDRCFAMVEAVREAVPEAALSLPGCAFSLAEGYEAAWRYVRHRIRYLPYDRIVKGAEGVLLTGEGSSLEKSLLLAALLKAKGFAVKICQGELPEGQAPAWQKPVRGKAPEDAPDIFSPAERFGLPEDLLADMRVRRQDEARERLLLLCGRTDMRMAALKTFMPAENQAPPARERRHFWVRVAVSLERWLDLDPTVGEKPGHCPARVDHVYELSDLPSSYYGTVKLTLSLQSGKDKTTLLTFSGRADRLSMAPLRLAFVPRGFSIKEAPAKVWQQFVQADRFVAVLNAGGRIVLGNSFDASGRVFQGSGDGRIDAAKRLGGGLGGLFGGGGGGGQQKPWRLVLTGVLDDMPGAVKFERTLLTQQPDKPPYALMSTFSYLMVPGPVKDVFFTRSYLTYLLDNESLIRSWDDVNAADLLRQLKPYPAVLYHFAQSLVRIRDACFPEGEAAFPCCFVGYENRVTGATEDAVSVQEGYDIVACPLLVRSDDDPRPAFHWGVALTELERLLAALQTGEAVLNAGALLFQAGVQQIPLKKVKKPEDLAFVAAEERACLARELAAGHTLILPEKPVPFAGRPVVPYYVIDGESGICLGRIAGRGQAATEYIEKIDTLMSVVGAIDSYAKFMRCMAGAIISPLAGKSQAQAQSEFMKCFTEWAMGTLFSGVKGFFNIDPGGLNMAADIAVGGIPGSPWGGLTGMVSGGVAQKLFGQ